MPSTGGVRHAGSEGTKYVVDEGNRAVAAAVTPAVVPAVTPAVAPAVAPAVVPAVVPAVAPAPAVHYCRERRSAAVDRGWPRWSAC